MNTLTNASSHPVIWQCWKGSARADTRVAPQPSPMPKRDAVKFWHRARELERRSRAPGRQDGTLGRNGLAVLHALIFDFLNHKSGRLDPSYDELARAAAISIRSVARGVRRLREAGVLSWVRRCIADQDETGRFVLRQISNAYEILTAKLVSILPEIHPDTWGARPCDGDSLARAAASLTDGLSIGHALRELENEDGLGAALARLGRANFIKKI